MEDCVGGIGSATQVLRAIGLRANIIAWIQMPIRKMQDINRFAGGWWNAGCFGRLGTEIFALFDLDRWGHGAGLVIVIAPRLIIAGRFAHFGK